MRRSGAFPVYRSGVFPVRLLGVLAARGAPALGGRPDALLVRRPGADLATAAPGVARVTGTPALVAALLIATVLTVIAGCSDPETVPAASGDRLAPGVTYSVDLDGDSTAEQLRVDGPSGSLTITDGDVVYRSRDKWHLVEACLGDTDGDGHPEVVALLDSEEGRHLGLFAYFGGEYRERLVTSELTPRPLSLQIVAGESGSAAGTDDPDARVNDLVVLTEEAASGSTEVRTTTYRWNGFGFTAIGTAEKPPVPE
jgi:hypothetical protein